MPCVTPTDTSEGGLEALITRSLVNETECVKGNPQDYDRERSFCTACSVESLSVASLACCGRESKKRKRKGGRTHCFVFSELDEFSGGREGGALTQSPDDVPSF